MEDFSKPPPGYRQSNSFRGPNYVAVKKEPAASLNEPSIYGRYGYYQGPNVPSLVNRPPIQSPLANSSPELSLPMLPRSTAQNTPTPYMPMFSEPPPYPYKKTISPSLGNATSSIRPYGRMNQSSSFPSLGAGQYVAVKQGNIRPQWAQDDYGYFKKGYNNHLNRKRNMSHEADSTMQKNTVKKKKKPLSQNKYSKKEWTIEESQHALDVETELNKLHKRHQLVIKFPDLELSRDIVSKLHPLIERVYFQQAYTPRFCFVSLSDASRIKETMEDLNKTKFGYGFLTAEPKTSKDDQSAEGPEDIDPKTLYVGNLSLEVTVEDVVKAYPKYKRIDIGFAKKMKYTRYAFVSFNSAEDAIEGFRNTHNTEMYSRNIIVRFRRLHGTVGRPGEPKLQNTRKRNESSDSANSESFTSSQTDVGSASKANGNSNLSTRCIDGGHWLYSGTSENPEHGSLKIKTELPEDVLQSSLNAKISTPEYHVPIWLKTEPISTTIDVMPMVIKEEQEMDPVAAHFLEEDSHYGGFK
ncbi:uncharacterized protein Pof isoform X1 [Euwallacea fornicatus]|uniref:uncharacterized protein Pof isoform X1 n=2 Tax=Euwallacea fornicatus TaxID=995702 RepID=UPI00338F5FD2